MGMGDNSQIAINSFGHFFTQFDVDLILLGIVVVVFHAVMFLE
jgi:hypothetical protein